MYSKYEKQRFLMAMLAGAVLTVVSCQFIDTVLVLVHVFVIAGIVYGRWCVLYIRWYIHNRPINYEDYEDWDPDDDEWHDACYDDEEGIPDDDID